MGTLATILGILGAWSAFPRLALLDRRLPELPCYVRLFDYRGTPQLFVATAQPPARGQDWRLRYRDVWGRTHQKVVPLQGGPTENLALLGWAFEPGVGVRDPQTQNVRNAIPIRWVVDFTASPPRMRLYVRYTSGESGDDQVDFEDLTAPDPAAPVLRQSNGDLEAIPVRVKRHLRGSLLIVGEVFMSRPLAFVGADGQAHFRLRGSYRWDGRNELFDVDYMDFVQAYFVQKHQEQVFLTDEIVRIAAKPFLIEVDLTGRRPEVNLQFRSKGAGNWIVPIQAVSCPVTLVRFSRSR